jgi:membrane glycosyltransferase
MIALHAQTMHEEFAQKSSSAQYQIVRRMMISNGFSIRASTRVAQADPTVMMETARNFVDSVREMLASEPRPKEWIMNMDQTAVFYAMVPRTTINKKGAKTVSIRDTAKSAVRITVALAITAAGTVMKPYIVMKGKFDYNVILFVLFELIINFISI